METPKTQLLAHAMKAYTWRLKTLASNIANMDTPGYRRMEVSFEKLLQEAQHSVESPRSITDVQPKISFQDQPPILENELLELADTQMRTQLVTRALREHFTLLRTGITGRSNG